jgi:acetyl-CoA carboxylase carboxyltransferase component
MVMAETDDGLLDVRSPMQGTVVRVERGVGQMVDATTPVVVVESMKMEYAVAAGVAGVVHDVQVKAGDAVRSGDVVAVVAPGQPRPDDRGPAAGAMGPPVAGEAVGEAVGAAASGERRPPAETGGRSEVQFGAGAATDEGRPNVPDEPLRSDLAEVRDRHAIGQDGARPEVVERRHASGQRTARENVDDLCDPGSFVEYGPLAIAAQRRRRSEEELIERTPADGLVAGVGTVDGRPTAVLSYDYTVLAGTQGYQNHRKKDRLFEVIERRRLPVVLLTEGGGGRPGDVDAPGVSGLDCLAFHLWGRLSGLVPMVGIASGRCFAGNAALLGGCDVVIATEGSNIGMGGPAMIEGGGLGAVAPEEIGPLPVQVANGVVDVAVSDEAEAVRVAKRYLSYFGDPVAEDWSAADQRKLRGLVPENRRQAYDVRLIIDAVADVDSVLELRRNFAPGMVTALARVDGRAVGIVANNPDYLGGAIEADGADKAARFMQLCDAFDLPLLFLCDTPGIMVGPQAEATGLVRHVNRLFVTGANLSVPFGTIVLRKGYGLGAQAMAGGSFKAPLFCVAWPTGEVGGMGLEGAVRLGFRKELEAIEDETEREVTFQAMVARAYKQGKALNSASHFEIDDVIDPADSRRWIGVHLARSALPPPRDTKKRPYIDTW